MLWASEKSCGLFFISGGSMYEYKCEIDRVVDGDTVDVVIDLGFDVLLKSRIRLHGIDTPETRTRDLEEKKYGIMAKEYLTKLLESSDDIQIQTLLDNKGKFGRVLGVLIADGINVNQKMIDEHLAVAYYGQSKSDIEAEHLQNRMLLEDVPK